MALDLASLVVSIRADVGDTLQRVKDVEKQTQNVAASTQALGTTTSNIQKEMTEGWVGVNAQLEVLDKATAKIGKPLLNFLTDAVEGASDLQETVSKTNVVFEELSEDMLNWSEDAASTMGLAKQTALDYASTIGDLATSIGLGKQQAAEMARGITQLSADLASFKNIDTAQAFKALQGVFTGNAESLKALGIVMNEATLKEYALAQGITTSLDKLSNAEQVMLRYNYVLQQTANAQGDFARTSDGLANTQRTISEIWEDLQATLGEVILPLVESLANALEGVLGTINKMPDWLKAISTALLVVVAALTTLYPLILKIITAITTMTSILGTAKIALGGWISLAVAAVAGISVLVSGLAGLSSAANETKADLDEVLEAMNRVPTSQKFTVETEYIETTTIKVLEDATANIEAMRKKLSDLITEKELTTKKITLLLDDKTGLTDIQDTLDNLGDLTKEIKITLGKYEDGALISKTERETFEKEMEELSKKAQETADYINSIYFSVDDAAARTAAQYFNELAGDLEVISSVLGYLSEFPTATITGIGSDVADALSAMLGLNLEGGDYITRMTQLLEKFGELAGDWTMTLTVDLAESLSQVETFEGAIEKLTGSLKDMIDEAYNAQKALVWQQIMTIQNSSYSSDTKDVITASLLSQIDAINAQQDAAHKAIDAYNSDEYADATNGEKAKVVREAVETGIDEAEAAKPGSTQKTQDVGTATAAAAIAAEMRDNNEDPRLIAAALQDVAAGLQDLNISFEDQKLQTYENYTENYANDTAFRNEVAQAMASLGYESFEELWSQWNAPYTGSMLKDKANYNATQAIAKTMPEEYMDPNLLASGYLDQIKAAFELQLSGTLAQTGATDLDSLIQTWTDYMATMYTEANVARSKAAKAATEEEANSYREAAQNAENAAYEVGEFIDNLTKLKDVLEVLNNSELSDDEKLAELEALYNVGNEGYNPESTIRAASESAIEEYAAVKAALDNTTEIDNPFGRKFEAYTSPISAGVLDNQYSTVLPIYDPTGLVEQFAGVEPGRAYLPNPDATAWENSGALSNLTGFAAAFAGRALRGITDSMFEGDDWYDNIMAADPLGDWNPPAPDLDYFAPWAAETGDAFQFGTETISTLVDALYATFAGIRGETSPISDEFYYADQGIALTNELIDSFGNIDQGTLDSLLNVLEVLGESINFNEETGETDIGPSRYYDLTKALTEALLPFSLNVGTTPEGSPSPGPVYQGDYYEEGSGNTQNFNITSTTNITSPQVSYPETVAAARRTGKDIAAQIAYAY